jgi:glycosyltransferase involved in cell wall biosynthesis
MNNGRRGASLAVGHHATRSGLGSGVVPIARRAASTIAAVKVLLVSFYFPPAGGGGVQRPLKLAQYLPTMGIETHVLAPDDPRWLHRDEGLRMPSQAWVHRARYVGVSGGKPSEVLAGTQGLERAVTHARLQLRRLVVPDENATWAITAIPAGIRLVREHGIDVVVSTSPPGSTHLIAAAIARATGIRWVADLRDSLVAHAHRRADTTATKAKAALHERVARLVAGRADAITCVSGAITEETRALGPRGPVVTIPNGADFDDVAGLERRPSDRFRITHTGSFFGRRDPRPFLQALADSGLDVEARFLGDFRDVDRVWTETLGLGDRLRLLPYAPRAESLALQRDSEALLLLIPEAGGRGKGVLSGKVFEYVAVARPILAVVPPDGAAAELIRETRAGVVAPPEDVEAIRSALQGLHERWRSDGLPDVELDDDWRDRLSRRTRVEEMAAVLRDTLA